MSTAVPTEILIPLIVATIAGINGWFLYFFRSKSEKVESDINKNMNEANSKVSELKVNTSNLERRIYHLERNTISEQKAKELIDSAIAPMKATLEDIKTNSKETSNNLSVLMLNFSHLMGKLNLEVIDTNKNNIRP